MTRKVLVALTTVFALCLVAFMLTACSETYTVTWQDWDGYTLETDYRVEAGTIPTYDGETPYAPSDGQYTYKFCGWDKEIVPATSSVIYTAQYDIVVRWENWDGTILEEFRDVYDGDFVINHQYNGENPTREPDAQYTYTYGGWNRKGNEQPGEAVYVPWYETTTNRYTVTWQNWDGTILYVCEVEYGVIPKWQMSEDPSKEGDAQYSYVFVGWSPSIEKVTGDVTYVAQYETRINEYTVIWKNWDDTVLELVENVVYGTTLTYNGDTPYKASDEKGDYTFIGWSPEVDVVTGDVTYVAQFSTAFKKYTVTWANWDGTVLEVDEDVEYGTTPTYDGETPFRAETAQCDYSFSGWTPNVDIVTGNVTYVAEFFCYVNRYAVTWKNWDGNTLAIDIVEYGEVPTYTGEAPTRPSTIACEYEFIGWDKPIEKVTGDIVYTAQYSSRSTLCTVTWKNWDGTVLEIDENVLPGTIPTYDGKAPVRDKTDSTMYIWDGKWSSSLDPVYSDVTFTAVFTEKQFIKIDKDNWTNYFSIDGTFNKQSNTLYVNVVAKNINPYYMYCDVEVSIYVRVEFYTVYEGEVFYETFTKEYKFKINEAGNGTFSTNITHGYATGVNRYEGGTYDVSGYAIKL